jgi:hypothetical protein
LLCEKALPFRLGKTTASLDDLELILRAEHADPFHILGAHPLEIEGRPDFRDSDNSVIAFMRKGKIAGDYLIVVCNFTPVPRRGYRVGVPEACFYQEILSFTSQRASKKSCIARR